MQGPGLKEGRALPPIACLSFPQLCTLDLEPWTLLYPTTPIMKTITKRATVSIRPRTMM